MSSELKKTILDTHNELRNSIALGQIPGYAQASKMAFTVGPNRPRPISVINSPHSFQQWSDELAFHAESHARLCDFKHDLCRKTKEFPYSGQNLAYDAISNRYPDPPSTLKKQITRWFQEFKDADMSYI